MWYLSTYTASYKACVVTLCVYLYPPQVSFSRDPALQLTPLSPLTAEFNSEKKKEKTPTRYPITTKASFNHSLTITHTHTHSLKSRERYTQIESEKGKQKYAPISLTAGDVAVGENKVAAGRGLVSRRLWQSSNYVCASVCECVCVCALTCTGLCLTSLLPGELSPEACWRRNCLAAWRACKRELEMIRCLSCTHSRTVQYFLC